MPAPKLVKMVKLNNLQHHANRDPQAYRRCVNEAFRIQAMLEGQGEAQCVLHDAAGRVLAEERVPLPGAFSHELAFSTAGVRVVSLSIQGNGQSFAQDLRLDVLEHAWEG